MMDIWCGGFFCFKGIMSLKRPTAGGGIVKELEALPSKFELVCLDMQREFIGAGMVVLCACRIWEANMTGEKVYEIHNDIYEK